MWQYRCFRNSNNVCVIRLSFFKYAYAIDYPLLGIQSPARKVIIKNVTKKIKMFNSVPNLLEPNKLKLPLLVQTINLMSYFQPRCWREWKDKGKPRIKLKILHF